MSAERPNFEANTGAVSGMATATIVEKVLMEDPARIRMDRVEDAMSVLKGEKDAATPKPPEPEPTKSQLFWREMFQTGDLTPYDRNKKAPKWDAYKAAMREMFTDPASFVKHFGEHVRKVDYELRGEKDIGDAKTRLQRIGILLLLGGVFWGFDYVTGPVWKTEFDRLTKGWKGDVKQRRALVAAVMKFVSVLNDKYATDLSNLAVDKLTGVKSGFNHQIADKGTDTINVGFVDVLEDKANAPMIESALRILFQIPVVGALIEQGAVRLTNFQEKSSLHTNFGKMNYVALGTYINIMRGLEGYRNESNRIHNWIDAKRPGADIKTRTITHMLTGFPRVDAVEAA